MEENRKNCMFCKYGCMGKECENLFKNEEYARLKKEKELGSPFNPDSPYFKIDKIKRETVCPDFTSIFIEYPIVVTEIESKPINYNSCLFHKAGSLVKIRPVGEEYNNKTFLGFLLGDLPTQISASRDKTTGVLTLSTSDNPGIFVPELGKIIFGYESWWSEISDPSELKEITDDDIENTWYVKLLRSKVGGKENE